MKNTNKILILVGTIALIFVIVATTLSYNHQDDIELQNTTTFAKDSECVSKYEVIKWESYDFEGNPSRVVVVVIKGKQYILALDWCQLIDK